MVSARTCWGSLDIWHIESTYREDTDNMRSWHILPFHYDFLNVIKVEYRDRWQALRCAACFGELSWLYETDQCLDYSVICSVHVWAEWKCTFSFTVESRVAIWRNNPALIKIKYTLVIYCTASYQIHIIVLRVFLKAPIYTSRPQWKVILTDCSMHLHHIFNETHSTEIHGKHNHVINICCWLAERMVF